MNDTKPDRNGNTCVQAAGATVRSAAGAAGKLGSGYRPLKFVPIRESERPAIEPGKLSAGAAYERSIRLNPELDQAGALKKALQKQKIKNDHAKQYRKAQKAAAHAKKAAEKTAKAAKRTAAAVVKTIRFVAKHPTGVLIAAAILFLLIILASCVSSCITIVNGGFNAIIASSYTAEDADIEGADMDYAALEAMLAEQISGIERTYQGYDEYRYDLDEIGHDPHVLASYLTAKYFMYSRTQVQMDLIALFGQQYDLKLTPVVETRYREELRVETYVYTDPATGKPAVGYYTYTETVAYDYYVLYVSLSNRSLDNIVSYNMDAEQAEMYAAYLQAQGNRPELFDGNPYASRKAYLVYDIPPEALSDTVFAAMIFEAEKHLGRAYVWGGASPSTGFDCSGYVSWVINHSGWNVGRLGAKALFNICTPVSVMDAKPGDLIFFWKTYNAPDPNAPTHVGIYVGGGMMIHCGNPISYADVTSPYWVSHFYSFGRLN